MRQDAERVARRRADRQHERVTPLQRIIREQREAHGWSYGEVARRAQDAEGSSRGRQCSTLKPYMNGSTSSPGAVVLVDQVVLHEGRGEVGATERKNLRPVAP